ncbi:Gfo/Idh/MocA family protein [Agromyces aerolatus]|uniref:Gfo/Idh/MocA family protein n=1 Tax=Agromyces sp. LY-1074 TaxID=3074080 RepID=UPI00285A90CC|nr:MULTISPECIES: Gfo/Idh/MocA family oxidoreductase [unclassified Agromyces]MDR5700476.1 Gfo/Idh/MocA family oxidoreductase [Agromyces sp. LY-1074]MDR5706997.1 Gfo/Idh/MocA family oxidoreductase [Agromyces sp. LY-1358]
MTDTVAPPAGVDAGALRLGVIGFGERGERLAQLVVDLEEHVAITCVIDTSERGRLAATAAYPEALVHGDRSELDAASIDAAIVATPDDSHATIAIELLERGIPLYLEKPIATTIADADAILDAAARTGTRIYVGHNMRHTAMARLMKEIVDRGEIGEVTGIWCRHFVGHGGDFYFKDWHADRSRSTGLLLQKAAHDIDFMHWLADSHSTRVVGMGDLLVYGRIADRRDRSGERMSEWLSVDNWPPLAQTGLNPVVDVEDLSMVMMQFESGALGSYQQCHYTPDYWRNFTVIGTEGRLENFGDNGDGVIRVWNRRTVYNAAGDAEYAFQGDDARHDTADRACLEEFVRFVRSGAAPVTSVLGGRYAVAAGVAATSSMRAGSIPQDIRPVDAAVARYFDDNQVRSGIA